LAQPTRTIVRSNGVLKTGSINNQAMTVRNTNRRMKVAKTAAMNRSDLHPGRVVTVRKHAVKPTKPHLQAIKHKKASGKVKKTLKEVK